MNNLVYDPSGQQWQIFIFLHFSNVLPRLDKNKADSAQGLLLLNKHFIEYYFTFA